MKRGLNRQSVREVLQTGGHLSPAQSLRCRVRYFSDGFVIGTKSFVNRYFDSHRQCFGAKRKDGARKMRRANLPDLYSLRDLQLNTVSLE